MFSRRLRIATGAIALLVLGVATASNAGGARPQPAAPQFVPQVDVQVAQKQATGAQREGRMRYVDRLKRVGNKFAGFGYCDSWVDSDHVLHVVVGFVGETPARVSRLLQDAPRRTVTANRRSVYTARELDRALGRAFQTGLVNSGWTLDRGRGIGVSTTLERLLASRNPRQLLGIDVGVIVEEGTVTAVAGVGVEKVGTAIPLFGSAK